MNLEASVDRAVELMEQAAHDIPALMSALVSLRNEVSGLLVIAEPELREAVGNTNVDCLKRRVSEADVVIAEMGKR